METVYIQCGIYEKKLRAIAVEMTSADNSDSEAMDS
jgi:hypothetical protein